MLLAENSHEEFLHPNEVGNISVMIHYPPTNVRLWPLITAYTVVFITDNTVSVSKAFYKQGTHILIDNLCVYMQYENNPNSEYFMYTLAGGLKEKLIALQIDAENVNYISYRYSIYGTTVIRNQI